MEEYSIEFKKIVDEIKKIDRIQIKRIYKPNGFECAIFKKGRNTIELFYRDGFANYNSTVKDKSLDVLVISIINEVLNSRPCIFYRERVEKSLTHLNCYEWDNDDVDAHVTRMIKASMDKDLERVSDMIILTGKPLSYYKERVKKKPGVYPGNLSKSDILFSNKCSEYNLYYLIGEKVLELSDITHGDIDKPLDKYTLEEEEVRFALEYLCARTMRFGVDIKLTDDYTALELGDAYANWSNSWNIYLSTIDPYILSKLNELAKNRVDVSPILSTVNSNMHEEGIKHILVLNKKFLN